MPLLLTGLLVFARVTALLLTLPVLSATGVPRWVSVFGGLGLALVIAPVVPAVDPSMGLLSLLTLGLAGELATGLIAGTTVRAVFASIAMGAEVASNQTGAAMATVFDPLQESQEPLLASLASWVAGLAFLAADLHLRCLEGLAWGFQALPPGAAGLPVAAAALLVEVVSTAVVLGVQVAGPVLAAMFGFYAFLGLLVKLAPRMNVFFALGLTGANALGLLVLAAALPWMLLATGAATEAVIAEALAAILR